jgi:hypothetical protein
MSRRRKLEATNLLNEAKKIRQGMLKEQITMMKGQMKNITSKRANKIICPFIILSSGTKKHKSVSKEQGF